MNLRHSLKAMAIAAAAMLGMASSQACTIQSSPWGPIVGSKCNLGQFTFGEFDLDMSANPNPHPFGLANLVVPNAHLRVNGPVVEVSLTVQNASSQRSARPFDAVIVGTVHQPATGAQTGLAQTLTARGLGPLTPGAARRYYIGLLSLPNRDQDWDVCVQAQADPPTATAPSGQVIESNESDNGYRECCRAYGPKPDTNAPYGSC